MSLRCCGLKSSGPPAGPLGKDLMAQTISSSETVMAGTSEGGGGNDHEVSGCGWGYFC